MKSLTTVQKVFKVFKVLSKVAMILCFVACGICLLGLVCGITWYTGGKVYGANMQELIELTESTDLMQMIGSLVSGVLCTLADGLVCMFAYLYLKKEQEDGTPFTDSGAVQIRNLGIKTIVFPLVAIAVSGAVCAILGVSDSVDSGNSLSIATGVMEIIAAVVFRYGAELERKNGQSLQNSD